MNRKQFLAGAAGGSLLLWLQACGGGGDAGNGNGGLPPNLTSCGADGASISNNHLHAVTIAVADLSSSTNKVYSIQGAADHDHQITLTVAQLLTLKSGASVTVNSTTTTTSAFGAHAHQVLITCV